MRWLYEAKKRHGLSVLNYMVTSNHIHLLVSDDGDENTIAQSIQLAAGRTGQEYNLRKNRKGAYWEDRYHATAVDTEEYLARCMVYIDMNMVRAGAVKEPGEWRYCGYCEIQNPKERYGLIDYGRLTELLNVGGIEELQERSRERVEEALLGEKSVRDEKWTRSIAVGSEEFVKQMQEMLGEKVTKRRVQEAGGVYELREPAAAYGYNFGHNNEALSAKNSYFWDESLG